MRGDLKKRIKARLRKKNKTRRFFTSIIFLLSLFPTNYYSYDYYGTSLQSKNIYRAVFIAVFCKLNVSHKSNKTFVAASAHTSDPVLRKNKTEEQVATKHKESSRSLCSKSNPHTSSSTSFSLSSNFWAVQCCLKCWAGLKAAEKKKDGVIMHRMIASRRNGCVEKNSLFLSWVVWKKKKNLHNGLLGYMQILQYYVFYKVIEKCVCFLYTVFLLEVDGWHKKQQRSVEKPK